MKKTITLILMIILSSFCFGYTLIDSEDFQDYTLGSHSTSDFLTKAGTKWNCTYSTAFPSCDRTLAGTGSGSGYWGITHNNDGNKYLVVSSLDGVNNNYRETSLTWDNDNSPTPSNNNGAYFLKMKMRILDDSLAGITGTSLLAFRGGIQAYASNFYGSNEHLYYMLGSVANSSVHSRLRALYNIDRMKPSYSGCEISTDRFSNVVIQHYYNSSDYLYNTKLFIDGQECLSYNDTYNQAGFGIVFSELLFKSIGGYEIAYDDIELYYGEISENEIEADYYESTFLDCPLGISNCIFYEPFAYSDGYNLSTVNYNFADTLIFDENAYIDDYIERELPNYIYIDVNKDIIFNINDTTTPSELEDNYLLYSTEDYCQNGLKVSDVTFLFAYPQNDTGINLDEKTQICFYAENKIGTIDDYGCVIVNNGEKVGYNIKYDFESKQSIISINVYENYFESTSVTSSVFVLPFLATCDKLDYFKISKLGSFENNTFIGVDSIFYNGLTDDTIDIDEVLENTTTIGSQEEALKNVAYAIGFTDSRGMAIFWFGIIVVGIFLVIQADIPSQGKVIGTIFVVAIGILAGNIWGFLDLRYVIILIFIIALAVAFIFTKVIKGNEV
jgi:hypothetical protein